MEVVDGWLVKLYPKVPTWGEIADVVEKIGHNNLAHSIRQVYITGEQTEVYCIYIYVKQALAIWEIEMVFVVICGLENSVLKVSL